MMGQGWIQYFTCSDLEISSPTLLLSRNNGGLKSPLIKNITDRSPIYKYKTANKNIAIKLFSNYILTEKM